MEKWDVEIDLVPANGIGVQSTIMIDTCDVGYKHTKDLKSNDI